MANPAADKLHEYNSHCVTYVNRRAHCCRACPAGCPWWQWRPAASSTFCATPSARPVRSLRQFCPAHRAQQAVGHKSGHLRLPAAASTMSCPKEHSRVDGQLQQQTKPKTHTKKCCSRFDLLLYAGFLYQPGDYEAATAYVRKLVEDSTLRQQMGREARLEVTSALQHVWRRLVGECRQLLRVPA